MFLLFRPPPHRKKKLLNEAMPKGWYTGKIISELSLSMQKANRLGTSAISLCINAELLLGTTSTSAFANGISQRDPKMSVMSPND